MSGVASQQPGTAGICRRNAEHLLALGQSNQPQMTFDLGGVQWLEMYIAHARTQLAPDYINEFVEIAGCFYGECLIETFGGSWARANDGSLAVVMQPHGYTFPFAAVARQVHGEEGASIERSFSGALAYLQSLAAAQADAAQAEAVQLREMVAA